MAKRKRKDLVPMNEEEAGLLLAESPKEEPLPVVENELPPDEEEEDQPKVNSVVADKYKNNYIENAKLNGNGNKAARRSNWDWLAQQIAAHCLDEKQHIRMDDFVLLLNMNSVDHSKWTNRNKGWEGRFRMTGRVALQKIVAGNNYLVLPNGDLATPPTEWITKYAKSN
jgi:hypothetical protein